MNELPKDFYLKNIQYKKNKNIIDDRFIQTTLDIFDNNEQYDATMKTKLGFLPTSIWKPDIEITKILKKIINDKCQTRKTQNSNRSDRRNGVNNGKCSVFNPHLAEMVYAAYCPQNAKVYDAFGGGGTRGYIATKMGMKYLGVEIRKEEVKRIKEQMKNWNMYFDFILEDSTKYIPNEKFDFAFTCPPYYDLEVYSNLKNDLSNAKSYEEYLIMLKKVVKNIYSVLKEKSFCVFVIGNFRNEKGELEHLNGDLIRIAKECNFKLWDEIIWNGASNVALTRCGKFEKNRKCVRIHEYIIVLKK